MTDDQVSNINYEHTDCDLNKNLGQGRDRQNQGAGRCKNPEYGGCGHSIESVSFWYTKWRTSNGRFSTIRSPPQEAPRVLFAPPRGFAVLIIDRRLIIQNSKMCTSRAYRATFCPLCIHRARSAVTIKNLHQLNRKLLSGFEQIYTFWILVFKFLYVQPTTLTLGP